MSPGGGAGDGKGEGEGTACASSSAADGSAALPRSTRLLARAARQALSTGPQDTGQGTVAGHDKLASSSSAAVLAGGAQADALHDALHDADEAVSRVRARGMATEHAGAGAGACCGSDADQGSTLAHAMAAVQQQQVR